MPNADQSIDFIAEAFVRDGLSVTPAFVCAEALVELQEEAQHLFTSGALRAAGVGVGETARLAADVRGDRIAWLGARGSTPAQRAYLDAMERLRSALNRELQLGLFEVESHVAVYPPGARYLRHLDRPHGSAARVVSCVLYLNRDWHADDGGALRLYLDDVDPAPHLDVLPAAGTFVCFSSDRFWHEVLPATRPRFSIAAWFRRRAPL